MTHTISDEAIQELLDERSITRVLREYCRAIDRMDFELLASVYWPDATDDHGSFVGTAPEFIAWLRTLLPRHDWTEHHLTNVLIDLDGDSAKVESYLLAFHGGPAHDARWNFAAGCRYVDRFERRDGEWKIADRVTVIEWTRQIAAQDPLRDGKFGAVLNRRDRTDPAYFGAI
ncbi:MAG: hypothetical protein JWO10_1782 [Microbacteriaceae bacterium]|nr:hypothetical protein [Microbacteriaceae bacterium]